MKLESLRISNFQSFGEEPTELTLEDITYLIGPNGSGKTVVLQALCRMFSFTPHLRRVLSSDFHVPINEDNAPEERSLWVEADFYFPELDNEDDDSPAIPPNFRHMRLDIQGGIPRLRIRLSATMGIDGDIEEILEYVLEVDETGAPISTAKVPRSERNYIQVHYLPARRDPSEHITFSTNALLGRLLRSIQWNDERETVKELTNLISQSLVENSSVNAFSSKLEGIWSMLHKGDYFKEPKLTFGASEIDSLLRHLSISFAPGHDADSIDYSRLSDGQKSMLYISLVLSSQQIGHSVLAGEEESFDPLKLNPPFFTIIAIEEPENSLSPHFIGRIVSALNDITSGNDCQALIATHAPSILKRVEPEHIRYLRLKERRVTEIKEILLPPDQDEAHKYVRQGVKAFPELYFSRLVILVEGDSEEIVLPRIMEVKGCPVDETAVTVTPLGGRHVNHFWRLLSTLEIPYLTLLDLDVSRYQGGWGRLKYVNDQLGIYQPADKLPENMSIPEWNNGQHKIRDFSNYLEAMRERGVYFSEPLDLDLSMMIAFPEAYEVTREVPSEQTLTNVLGNSYFDADQYSNEEKELFKAYHQKFKLGSKPATHIEALANLTNEQILENIPSSIDSLIESLISKLRDIPE